MKFRMEMSLLEVKNLRIRRIDNVYQLQGVCTYIGGGYDILYNHPKKEDAIEQLNDIERFFLHNPNGIYNIYNGRHLKL